MSKLSRNIAIWLWILSFPFLVFATNFEADDRSLMKSQTVCPCTIWPDTETPVGASDAAEIELGVKFKSDDDGYINAIRFYKTAGNDGTHIGHLWTEAGVLLGEVIFTTETASGWQTAYFDSSIAIAANTTYVASYYAPQGNYAFAGAYFSSTGFDNAPLHALQDGENGSNGVYKYGPSGSLFSGSGPDSFNAGNYWVDVEFDIVPRPDTTPPSIILITPSNGSVGTSTLKPIQAKFSEALDATSVNGTTAKLFTTSAAPVAATVSYDAGNNTVVITPNTYLEGAANYSVLIEGGIDGVRDVAGNTLTTDYTWSFTTTNAEHGSGGPILLIVDPSDLFGRYYAEILRAEGLTEFHIKELDDVKLANLKNFDIAILAPMAVSKIQAKMFEVWVNKGGNLITFRPDQNLKGIVGLNYANTTIENGYLKIDTTTKAGAGLVGDTIQYHDIADALTLHGASEIAKLYSDESTATPYAAVALNVVGFNGGRVVSFAYDLARSVVYTRQGNPAWAGLERDGQAGPIRSDDLFFGGADPDWVNLNKVMIPQADEQQRLLANLIITLAMRKTPLPRFWYLPSDKKAVVVMTGDDHGNGGTSGRFDQYAAFNPGCSLDDWECVRATSYIYTSTPLSNEQAVAYDAQGFEIGLHVSTNCDNWSSYSELDGIFTSQLQAFSTKYTGIAAPLSNRTHCIPWSDWASHAKAELAHGIRLDTNYYYWPPAWIQDRPGMFTGSGMPMRFADVDGSMIDVYQAATQMTDESGQTFPLHIDTLLDNALGAQGYYGVFTANMHTDSPSSSGSDAIVASALARDVPIVSARQMLVWVDARNNSSFKNIAYGGRKLTFRIKADAAARNLRAMLPTESRNGILSEIKKGGTPITFTLQTIKGIEYAIFDGVTGNYKAAYSLPKR